MQTNKIIYVLFADDTNILYSNKSSETRITSTWLSQTNFMVFSKLKSIHIININNQKIELTD